MTCGEEFGLFLSANPTYVAYGSEPEDPIRDNRSFFCSTGEERRYYVPNVLVDCDRSFAEFLSENPQFMLAAAPIPGDINRNIFEYSCFGTSGAIYYGYTVQANYERFIARISFDDREDGLTEEGRLFFESERPSGMPIEEWYARNRGVEYYVVRMFAADGSWFVVVRGGSRYALQFPQYIVPV